MTRTMERVRRAPSDMICRMPLDNKDLELGTELFVRRLEELIDSDPEISDIHSALEQYSANKYSLGNSASNHRIGHRVGGKNEAGIDFYSQYERSYHVGQCKIPERDWLEANPTKPKLFGPSAVQDARSALRYLVGDSDLKANEKVQQLYASVAADRDQEDFSLVVFIIVYGRLNPKARDACQELKDEYQTKQVSVVLQEIDDLVEEFLVGSTHSNEEIKFDLHTNTEEILRARNYCYFLANTGDLYKAFLKFGWRLFDLNLRYEIRNSSINGEIVRSLKFQKSRRQFHHYNNGLIIIAKNYSISEKENCVRLHEAQIVNGLQTVKSIYNAIATKEVGVAELEKDCVVQVKVITAADADFVSKVVQSTNNQNPMAARNLRSNNREQKVLRRGFALLTPRWFYQLKEGEWKSLTSEGARFFEQVVGYRQSEFKPEPTRQFARVIDNQDAAKAWLAFIGFADQSGDRVTHFFAEDSIYERAFSSRPSNQYWVEFSRSDDWDKGRTEKLEMQQGHAIQYLLAYFLWEFVNGFVPSPQRYREQALDEGVRAGKISKASGSYTTPPRDQDAYLADNRTYQTWRLMANMKELLVESASQVLCRKYGPLNPSDCENLLKSFEADRFRESGDIRGVAQSAAVVPDLGRDQVYSRIFRMLHHVAQQFWEDKKQQLLSTSRLRTVLVRREVAAEFKSMIWQVDQRVGLDRPWKPEGVTFLDSLPNLQTRKA